MIPGKLTRLRPVERADLPRFVKWFADPEVRSGLATFLPLSEEQEERWFEHNLAGSQAEQAWAIDAQIAGSAPSLLSRERDLRPSAAEPGWLHIGSCGFHEIDWRNRSGECGIAIGDKSQWGKGYGTDAMRALVKLGFDQFNLHRIMLQVFDDNPRAIRSYEKVGFKTEGRLRESNFHAGRYRDTLIMAILRPEWEA
jgi:RimJ/RimL family protein N-acetyltransferase